MQAPEVPDVPAQKPRKNTRRARRQKPRGSTRVIAYRNALGLGKNIALRILDLSETGVRLVLKERPALGLEFEINLDSPSYRTVKMLAQVVWVTDLESGEFLVGARFAKSMAYTDLLSLVKP